MIRRSWLVLFLLTYIVQLCIGQISLDSLESVTAGPGIRYVEMYGNPTVPATIYSEFIEDAYQHTSFTQLMDNFVDDAHVHFETTADYDGPNPYLIGFTGASYKWTKYYFDGMRIDHGLLAGDASFHLPLSGMDVNFDAVQDEVRFKSRAQQKNKVSLRNVRGSLGGRVGFTDWFLNNISMHRSAFERQIFDIKQRPYTSWHTDFLYQNEVDDSSHESHYKVSIQMGSRVHVDQDYDGANTSYDEKYFNLNSAGTLLSDDHALGEGVKYLVGYQQRDHFGGEYQYQRDETAFMRQLNTAFYSRLPLKDGQQITGLSFNYLQLDKVNPDFSKNLYDQDGEGLEPYYQDGSQLAATLFVHRQQGLSDKLTLNIEAHNTIHRHSPTEKSWTNAIYKEDVIEGYASLHTIDWRSNEFASALLENNAKLEYRKEGFNQSIKASIGLHFYGMLVSENNLLSLAPSLDLAWHGKLGSKFELGARVGFHPNRYDLEQVRLLSPDYLEGRARFWKDNNENRKIDIGELGEELHRQGGRYMQASEDLGVSSTYYVEIPLIYKPSKNWKWMLIPQYRQFRNTWSVEHERPLEETGQYINKGLRRLWYPNDVIDSYVVQPLDGSLMANEEGTTNGFLFDQPFYAGANFRFECHTKKWFFSGSMTGNMVVGYSGLGNGPLHNNVNSPSISMADPNIRSNQPGRLDTDRSFLARVVANYKYNSRGSVGIQLKYKDGQSFAYYEQYIRETSRGRQVAYYQPEIRGDNPLIGKMGRREDFFTNLEIKAQHRFPLKKGQLEIQATLHNVFDFANETSEYIFGNIEGFSRSPLELQVPRSATLTVSYVW